MPFFKYTAEFPYLHECPECEAQFVSIVPDVSKVLGTTIRNCLSCKVEGSMTQPWCLSCNGFSNWIGEPVPKKRGKS